MKLFDVYPLYDVTPVKAKDVFVYDENGTEYLDLYGGHAVISIGHGHPHYIKKLKDQLDNIGFYSNVIQNPLQQELELKKQEAGKDVAQFDNITQDADETAPDQEARVDEPLVAQPVVTGGENPGVPAEMKKKQSNNENTELSLLKKLSGVI